MNEMLTLSVDCLNLSGMSMVITCFLDGNLFFLLVLMVSPMLYMNSGTNSLDSIILKLFKGPKYLKEFVLIMEVTALRCEGVCAMLITMTQLYRQFCT